MSDDLNFAGETPEFERSDPASEDSITEELLAAFVLGATEADEGTCLARRLAREPDLAQKLAAYTQLTETMLYSAPLLAAPLALASRLAAALAEPTLTPSRTGPPGRLSATPAPSARRWNWPHVAVAAAMLLLVALNLYWLREVFDLRRQQAEWQEQQTQLNEQQAELFQRLADRDALLAALVATTGERYTMTPPEPGSPAMAQVAWLPDSHQAVLRATSFPVLAQDQVYQMWLIRDGQRTSGGLFTVDPGGDATFVFTPPEPLENFDRMGITPEPAGGSPGPTAPPVVTAGL